MTVSHVQERSQHGGRSDLRESVEQARHSEVTTGPASMVIFGITGDLSRKKLIPAIYDLEHGGHLSPDFDVLGLTRDASTVESRLREAVIAHSRAPFDPEVWGRLCRRIHFIQGSFDDPAAFTALSSRLAELDVLRDKPANYVFYLSIPPWAFERVCEGLADVGLNQQVDGWRRIVVEKPFGHDLASSQVLEATLERAFDPSAIYRVDHYLGKETVQNILALRFTNGIFEPLWNSRYVDHVQITMAESVGVTGRGAYYDGVGATRDVIQNHLLQLLALIAMDRPATFEADNIAAEKSKVLAAATLLGPLEETTARGQYTGAVRDGVVLPGLTEEDGFPADSTTETFAALTVGVDTPRWKDVPFYVRTGKRLARRSTEIAVAFTAPDRGGPATRTAPVQNVLVFRVQPDDGIELQIGAKRPGDGMTIDPISLDSDFGAVFAPAPTAYERLLCDVLRGDDTLFPRRAEIESSWRLVDPVLDFWAGAGRPDGYEAGSDGPASAGAIMTRAGRMWRPL